MQNSVGWTAELMTFQCTSFIFRPLNRHEKESLYQGDGCYSTSLRRVAHSWATTSSQLIMLMLKEYFLSLQSGSKPQPQSSTQPFLAEALITCLNHFKMLLGFQERIREILWKTRIGTKLTKLINITNVFTVFESEIAKYLLTTYLHNKGTDQIAKYFIPQLVETGSFEMIALQPFISCIKNMTVRITRKRIFIIIRAGRNQTILGFRGNSRSVLWSYVTVLS